MLDLLKAAGWNTQTMGDVDHRIVKAPYVRLDMVKEGEKGDRIFKYDMRFTQPNRVFISSDVLHSLEHFLLVGFRERVSSFVGVAPMGCHTGLYLFLLNEMGSATILSHLEIILNDILEATEVPLSTELTCGHASMHNLEGSKAVARQMLAQKDKWLEVV